MRGIYWTIYCLLLGIPCSPGRAQDDAAWAAGFDSSTIPSFDAFTALTVSPENILYVGGSFDSFYSTNMRHIAAYDGRDWLSLDQGLNGDVLSLICYNSNLYAGGRFTMAGDIEASKLVRWDGARWWPLADGEVDGDVTALAWYQDDLYVAGTFNHIDGVETAGLARWNGSTWSSVGGSLSGASAKGCALMVHNDALYVGGHFTSAGGMSITNVARWDRHQWSPLGEGFLPENVTALALAANEEGVIFVGGGDESFSSPFLASWDGERWHHFSEVGHGNNMAINALAYYEDSLYVANLIGVGPYFGGTNGGEDVHFLHGLGRWDGAQWHPTKAPLRYGINSMATFGNQLYVTGILQHMMKRQGQGITRFDGKDWIVYGNGLSGGNNSSVLVLKSSPHGLLAGGRFFTDIDWPYTVDVMALWNGKVWSHLGDGIQTPDTAASTGWKAHSIELGQDQIYVAGSFQLWNQPPTESVLAWDGTNWISMSAGFPSFYLVRTVRQHQGQLYAGGNSGVHHWNGSQWVETGLGIDGTVYALESWGDVLVAGGDFTAAEGLPANNVAIWDGQNWSSMQNGTDGPVLALRAASHEKLIVGGEFRQAGDLTVNHIATWENDRWHSLGSGFSNGVPNLRNGGAPANTGVRSVDIDANGSIFAGGNFTVADGQPANFIARWRNGSWEALGSGVDHIVYSVAVAEEGVYLGGDFIRAGNRFSLRFALWQQETFRQIPSLQIDREAQHALLSWPEDSTDYVLEQRTPSINDPDWVKVTNAWMIIDGRKEVRLPLHPHARWFRLRK